ncbi:GNAT family N-acetyltransferase [Hymenobacter sp. BT559]|uniref:GNAT family N-acetyltransferase n=1 Tax=Hymenobacter sp. BT559 TaxID=2795729 RepID=UPI0018EC0800|nr:GNAT family N-acetyltransferase [Hymenobacter sp. BT559]
MQPAPTILPATLADAPALTALINQAYRGPASPQAWTTEMHLLEGPRISEIHVRDMVATMGINQAALLKCVQADQLLGCVYLEPKAPRLYLGTLAVAPAAQAQGVGRQLLAHAEAYARQQGCTTIKITVLSARPELLAWYERHGYVRTGQHEPFPDTTAFGQPRQPLTLLELTKSVA